MMSGIGSIFETIFNKLAHLFRKSCLFLTEYSENAIEKQAWLLFNKLLCSHGS